MTHSRWRTVDRSADPKRIDRYQANMARMRIDPLELEMYHWSMRYKRSYQWLVHSYPDDRPYTSADHRWRYMYRPNMAHMSRCLRSVGSYPGNNRYSSVHQIDFGMYRQRMRRTR